MVNYTGSAVGGTGAINLARFHDFTNVVSGGTVVINRDNPTVAVNYYETEEFREFCELMKLWNESGFFIDDLVTRKTTMNFRMTKIFAA